MEKKNLFEDIGGFGDFVEECVVRVDKDLEDHKFN